MASLSHASFATPNTQQLSPTHKLLPSHLSMDPASSSSASLSTLSQPYSSAELASWLQKPNAKLSHSQLHTMSSFNHQYGITSPLYEGYAEAGDSVVEQGFIGGDDPLLTSSWEALDKLVSASMTGSGDGNDQISEFAYSSAQGSTLQSTSPSSMIGVEQKPLSALNIGNNQKGGVCTMWENNQANASNAHTTPSNVGLNLASLITADPGFVERAAKFSSYSQQAHNSSFNQCANNNIITNTNNALSLENFNLACARKLASMSALCNNGDLLHRGNNVAMEHDDIKTSFNTLSTLETKQSIAPQRSSGNLSGSKKKREEATKDGEVDDAGANAGRKRAKGGERTPDEEDRINGNNNSKVGRVSGGDEKMKVQQCMGSNSAESQQNSGVGKAIVSKPNGSHTSINNNNGSSTASQAAPKPDFIHVRARRGQATDSHSLAERVRREKISERMKYLQDLVPGCTKVTGKAMMLDEIINYVQSLQRQVEFLSMKLAAIHPSKLEFNFESLFGKEVVQPSIVPNNHSVSYAPESLAHMKSYPLLQENVQQLQPHHQAFPEASSMQTFGSDVALRRSLGMLSAASSDTFGDQSISSQITDSWDEDLQSLVQLGFPQTPLNMNPSLHGALLQGQRKTEL